MDIADAARLDSRRAPDAKYGAMRYISMRSWAFVVIVGALGLSPWLRAQPPAVNALTQHYDRTRVGATLGETVLNTTSVVSGRFGKLWTLYADGQIVAQPLYVSGLRDRHDGQHEHAARAGHVQRRDRRDDAQHRLRLRRRRGDSGAPTAGRCRSGRPGSASRAPAAKTSTCGAPTIRSGASWDAGGERRQIHAVRGRVARRRAAGPPLSSCTRSTCRTARTGVRPP